MKAIIFNRKWIPFKSGSQSGRVFDSKPHPELGQLDPIHDHELPRLRRSARSRALVSFKVLLLGIVGQDHLGEVVQAVDELESEQEQSEGTEIRGNYGRADEKRKTKNP